MRVTYIEEKAVRVRQGRLIREKDKITDNGRGWEKGAELQVRTQTRSGTRR